LNTDSDEADVTSLGRPFHTFAPATGKAQPPIVDRRQVGTSRCSVEADLSLRRCGMSATHVYILRGVQRRCVLAVGQLGTAACLACVAAAVDRQARRSCLV